MGASYPDNEYALSQCHEWLGYAGTAEQILQNFHAAALRVVEALMAKYESEGVDFVSIPTRENSTITVAVRSSDFAKYVSDIWMLEVKDKGQSNFLTMTSKLGEASAAAESCIAAPTLLNYDRFTRLRKDAFNTIENSNKAGEQILAKRKKTKANRIAAGKASGEARGRNTTEAVIKGYKAQLNASHAPHEIAGILSKKLGITDTQIRRIIKKENLNKTA